MWIEDNNKDEENKPQANVGAGGGGSAPLGSNTPQGNPSTISPIQNSKPQSFGTIQDYLGKNVQQGEDLGNKFTSSLSNAQNKDKGDIDVAAEGTKSDIKNNTINFDSGLVNKAAATPTEVANSPTDLNGFLKQWNASYSGPSSFEGSTQYANAANAANDATQKSEQLKTAGGREQLIQDQFNVYGQGNKGLDQALLQSSSAFPKVQELQKGFGSIQDYLSSKANEVNPLATAAQATTQATKDATQAPFANKLTEFQNGINEKAATAQNTAADNQTAYQKDFASGNAKAVQKDLTDMGVDPSTVKSITEYLSSLNSDYSSDPNLSRYYQFNPKTDVTTANTATDQDYQNAKALQTLTGVDYGGVLNPADQGKASTANTKALSGIDADNLNKNLKTGLSQQDNALLNAPVPPLGEGIKNLTDKTESTHFAQKYINAMQRQGQSLDKNNPTLQNLFQQAYQAYFQYNGQPEIQNGLMGIIETVSPYLK